MQKKTQLDFHGRTRRGVHSARNHDHFAIASLNKSVRVHQSNIPVEDESRVYGELQGRLFLVADGIGAGEAPARASSAAVDSVVQYFVGEMPWAQLNGSDPADVRIALQDALDNAREELQLAGEGVPVGTTMTLAFVSWPDLYVAHVGNGRCYLRRGGRLHELTREHTVAEMRRSIGGRVTDRSERLLWNAIGAGDLPLHAEVQHRVLEPEDALILVTDGVPREATDSSLATVDTSAEELCDHLLDAGSGEDRTAIVARFLPSLPPAPVAAQSSDPAPRFGGQAKTPRRKPSDRLSPTVWALRRDVSRVSPAS